MIILKIFNRVANKFLWSICVGAVKTDNPTRPHSTHHGLIT